jgi:Predicted membrane protein
MTKEEFLSELRLHLAGVTTEERETALAYYEEFFNDMSPETDGEVITKLGTPEQVAQDVLDGLTGNFVPEPIFYSNTEKQKQNSSLIIKLLLVVFVLPIVLLLGFSAVCVLLSVVAVCVLIPISLLCVAVAAIAFCIKTWLISFAQALLMLGIALICTGLACIIFMPSFSIAKIIFTKGKSFLEVFIASLRQRMSKEGIHEEII